MTTGNPLVKQVKIVAQVRIAKVGTRKIVVGGRDARTEAEVKVRQGHQSRNAGHLQKPATPRKRVLPRTSRRNASTVVWTSDLQT